MKTQSISLLSGVAISLAILNNSVTPAQAVVLGPNLVTNGDFTSNSAATNNFTSGWTNSTGTNGAATTATGWNFGPIDNFAANFLVKTGQSDYVTTGKGPTGQQGYIFSQFLTLYGSGSLPSADGTVNPWFVLQDADPTLTNGKYYDATITQSLTGLVIGQDYQVSFYQASGQENQGQSAIANARWAVNLGTTNVSQTNYTTTGQLSTSMTAPNNGTTTTGVGSVAKGVNSWQQETMTFKAASASETLSFLAVGGPSGKPPMAMLTGITVKQVIIPEPAEYIGTLAGIGSCLLLRKRLKQKK
jgi:hypothetical protein